ncbi:hypothetical protein RCL1_003859 [Eukaryota sp. TZLM3-RCL]
MIYFVLTQNGSLSCGNGDKVIDVEDLSVDHAGFLICSQCLLGEAVRYDGCSQTSEKLLNFAVINNLLLIGVCPEVLGGLHIPRTPCEITSVQPLIVSDRNGKDQTNAFLIGAEKVLDLFSKLPQSLPITFVLKECSPSCGVNLRYDGTFSGRKVSGQGVLIQLFKSRRIPIKVWSSIEFD